MAELMLAPGMAPFTFALALLLGLLALEIVTSLLGGSLLVVADTLARTMLAPRQLPVGILTALVGVPVFLLLLYHSRSLHGEEH